MGLLISNLSNPKPLHRQASLALVPKSWRLSLLLNNTSRSAPVASPSSPAPWKSLTSKVVGIGREGHVGCGWEPLRFYQLSPTVSVSYRRFQEHVSETKVRSSLEDFNPTLISKRECVSPQKAKSQ